MYIEKIKTKLDINEEDPIFSALLHMLPLQKQTSMSYPTWVVVSLWQPEVTAWVSKLFLFTPEPQKEE